MKRNSNKRIFFSLFYFIVFFTGSDHRWSWPFGRTTCISCCQKPFARWQSRRCTMRRIGHFRPFLQVFITHFRYLRCDDCQSHFTMLAFNQIISFFLWFQFFLILNFLILFDYRNKVKYLNYLRKRCNVNPARGPFHFRAPCRIFFKAVRGKRSNQVCWLDFSCFCRFMMIFQTLLTYII